MLRFGVSGVPRSSARPGTEAGIRRARELGLDCLEMAWVNGVRMGPATAGRIAEAARACDVELTAHAPYAINLCGSAEISRRSVARLVRAGRLAGRCGARSFCFHAGYYPRAGHASPQRRVAAQLARVASRLQGQAGAVDVRPELTGRASQLGTLQEILAWSAEIPGVRPCLDFAHQFARHGGAFNSYDEFGAVLQEVSDRLGPASLRRLHVHVSGIEYGPRGERRHLPLRASRFRYRELLRALKDFRAAGWVVSESPAREDDAVLLQRCYRRLR